MADVIISRGADDDLDQIFDAIRETSGYAAVAAHNAAFDKLYDQLGAFPESGHPRPSLGPGIRIGVVAPYLVIHRYDAPTDTVMVLRILHGRRDLESEMRDRTP